MALGGLLGIGSSKETSKKTDIDTTTKTNIRDIGVTGKQFKDIAKAITAGNVETQKEQSKTLRTIVQNTGSQYNRLVGGAGLVTKAADETAESSAEVAESAKQAATEITKTSREQAGDLLATTKSVAAEQTDVAKDYLPWIVGIATVITMVVTLKG